MLRTLWNDGRGEISEYALILSLILMLGIALIRETEPTLTRVYQQVASHQASSDTATPKG